MLIRRSGFLSKAPFFFLSTIVLSPLLFSAPGDVQLEILTYTGDANAGPGGNSITSFEVSPSFDFAPVAMGDSGVISFAANVDVDGDLQYGFYQVFAPEVFSTILQSGGFAPGIIVGDPSEPSGVRHSLLSASPARGFSVSRDGNQHAFTVFTELDGSYLYSALGGQIASRPTTWPDLFTETQTYWEAVSISDGRGTTQERSGGTSERILVSDSAGPVFWERSDAIFRSLVPGDISAIMFKDSPAPGFDTSENAMLDTPLALRGIDALENTVFLCRVTKNSGFKDAIYRHNVKDNSLTLLFVDGETSLPGGPGLEGLTADVQAEDVFVSQNGAVYIRGKVSSTLAGFWRITVNAEGDIAIELIELFSSNGFNPTDTDLGPLEFRNINLGDWAVSENGTVFFSSDLRGGETTSASEGVWKIDPDDFSIKTVARLGQPVDPTEPATKYHSFSHITAAGADKLAFIAELDNGKRGLFATDANGGVVQIAREGVPLVPCEIEGDLSLQCRLVESIHFTPDHVGEDLIINKGSPGLNKFGQLAFLATLEDGITALVKASYEGEERPIGKTYIWDGGAGTNDWHTVTGDRSNWLDIVGTPWDHAPGDKGDEKVIIPNGFNVNLNGGVSIRDLTLDVASLSLFADLEFSHFFSGAEGSVIDFNSGKLSSEGGDFTTSGDISKSGAGAFTMDVDDVKTIGSFLTVKSGQLTFKNTISNFEDMTLLVESGLFTFDENLTVFKGDSASITVENGTLDFQTFALQFEADTVFHADDSAAVIKLGRPEAVEAAFIKLRRDGDESVRKLLFSGDGSFEIRKDIDFIEGDSLVNDHTGPEGTGLFVNIIGNEFLTVPDGASFLNLGRLILQDGGLTYSSNSNTTGEIINRGILLIPAGSVIESFDCSNEGTIILEGDTKYGDLRFNSRSRLQTTGGSLVPKDPDHSQLIFEKYSDIVSQSGDSRLEFPIGESVNLKGEVDVQTGASLMISNASTGDSNTLRVGQDSELTLDGFTFDSIDLLDPKITGQGKVTLKGTIKPRIPDTTLKISTQNFRFEDAELKSFPDVETQLHTKYHFDSFDRSSNGAFSNVSTEKNANIFCASGVSVTLENSLELNSEFAVEGILKVGATIVTIFEKQGPFGLLDVTDRCLKFS